MSRADDRFAWLRAFLVPALATGLWIASPSAPAPAQTVHFPRGTKIGGWHLSIRDDRFTGLRNCSLRGGSRGRRIVYHPGVLVFRFAPNVDTLDAWYRVDAGQPMRWQDDFPALIALGRSPEDGLRLDNPTEGRVTLPITKLAGAHEIWIRPSRRAAPQRFRLGDVAAAVARASAAGCAFEKD